MRPGRAIEWTHPAGNPVIVGDTTITPVARSLIARWPGGGAAWSGPAAILVERGEKTERIPVANLTRVILWGLRLGATAVVAAWIARDRARKD